MLPNTPSVRMRLQTHLRSKSAPQLLCLYKPNNKIIIQSVDQSLKTEEQLKSSFNDSITKNKMQGKCISLAFK